MASTEECREAITSHLGEYYPSAPPNAFIDAYWKRTSKRKDVHGRWVREFSNSKANATATVGEDDDEELYILTVTNCGTATSPFAHVGSEMWNSGSASHNFSDYYFAMTFDQGPGRGIPFVLISPKAYFDTNQCVYDQPSAISEELSEIDFSEAMEAVYEYHDGDIADARSLLLFQGMVENPNLLADEEESSALYSNGVWVGDDRAREIVRTASEEEEDVVMNYTGYTSIPIEDMTTPSTDNVVEVSDIAITEIVVDNGFYMVKATCNGETVMFPGMFNTYEQAYEYLRMVVAQAGLGEPKVVDKVKMTEKKVNNDEPKKERLLDLD